MRRAVPLLREARHLGVPVRHTIFFRPRALALVPAVAFLVAGGAGPALAASAALVPPVAEAQDDGGAQQVVIAPMPEDATTGAYCLAGATLAMAAAFAAGPTESLLLISGAMQVPSGTAVMFIPLLSLLGGAACSVASGAQPAVHWAIEQSDTIAAQASAAGRSVLGLRAGAPADGPAGSDGSGKDKGDKAGAVQPVAPVRPLTEDETQSVGCVGGALAGFGAAMASSPMEIAMLSAGAATVVSSTPILFLGLVSSIVASGCAIGNYAILPAQALVENFGAVSDSVFGGLNHFGSMVREATSDTMARLTGGTRAVEVADGSLAR